MIPISQEEAFLVDYFVDKESPCETCDVGVDKCLLQGDCSELKEYKKRHPESILEDNA